MWLCIPDGLGVHECKELHGQACSGEPHMCSSPAAQTLCQCRQPTDAGVGIWECMPYLP
jgi:hypothetical protein